MNQKITVSNVPMRMKVRDLISLLEQSVLDMDQKVSFTIEFHSERCDNEQLRILREYLYQKVLTGIEVGIDWR